MHLRPLYLTFEDWMLDAAEFFRAYNTGVIKGCRVKGLERARFDQVLGVMARYRDQTGGALQIAVDLPGDRAWVQAVLGNGSSVVSIPAGSPVWFILDYAAVLPTLPACPVVVVGGINSFREHVCGDSIEIAHGQLFESVEKHSDCIIAVAKHCVSISAERGLTIAGIKSGFGGGLSPTNEIALRKAVEYRADCLLVSMVETPEQVARLRLEAEAAGFCGRLVSKVETLEGIKNLEPILACSDAGMQARGDLLASLRQRSREFDLHTLGELFKRARKAVGKPVISASGYFENFAKTLFLEHSEIVDASDAFLNFDGLMLQQLKIPATAKHLPHEVFTELKRRFS